MPRARQHPVRHIQVRAHTQNTMKLRSTHRYPREHDGPEAGRQGRPRQHSAQALALVGQQLGAQVLNLAGRVADLGTQGLRRPTASRAVSGPRARRHAHEDGVGVLTAVSTAV